MANAPQDAGAAPADQDTDSDTITITTNPDGSYSVSVSGDDDAAPGDSGDGPQTVKTVAEVLALVHQELTENDDPQQAWNAEASTRDASGQRGSAPTGPGPVTSL